MIDNDTVKSSDTVSFRIGSLIPPIGRRITISKPFADNTAIADGLLEIESRFSAPDARIFKNDHASTVFSVPVNGTQLVVKRYNPVAWTKEWRRAVRRSRAKKTWENAVRLQSIGINTVVPVALVEHRWGPLCFRATFISLYMKGLDAQEYFEASEIRDEQKRKIAEKITRSLASMHSSGIIHGDTKARNVLVDGQRITWLDLDAMSVPPPLFVLGIKKRKDWRLLLYNWKDLPQIQRMFIAQMQRHLSRAELFGILSDLIRYRKRKSETSDPAAKIKLLQCAGISAAAPSPAEPGEPLETVLPRISDPKERQDLLAQLGEEIGFFHGCGFVHGHLGFENLQISKERPPRFFFSGVEKTRHFRRFSFRKVLGDLVRFNRDARRFLSDSDRLHLFSGYFRALGREKERKKWMAVIERADKAAADNR